MATRAMQFDGGRGSRKTTPPKNFLNPTIKGISPVGPVRPTGQGSVLKPSSGWSSPFAGAQRSGGGGGGGGGGQRSYGGGGGGGGGSYGMDTMSFAAPAPPPAPSIEEYQASDQILTAALGALDRALKDYNAQYDTDLGNYERDYTSGMKNLGWRDMDQTEQVKMGWDWNDLLSSSGRAYQNQVNDFANRGMLQSQGYLDAQRLLERSLNDQRGAMDLARTDFLGDMGRRKAEFGNQDTLARQQARAESAARRAAEYGIV